MSAGPLSGITVCDLSRVLAGPSCTQLLGDLGAEVIKIERPGAGDDTRRWGPPFLRDREGRDTPESAYYLSANRNKRSVAIDIAHPEGQTLVRDIVARSDVLVENFKVGGLARYGLGHAELMARFPGLVYCSITGFGQTGPYAARAGYDLLVQGMGGIMSVTGDADRQPTKVGVAVADSMCGMYAAVAILAALRARAQSGAGQHIDIGLADTQVAWLGNQAQAYLTSGEVPVRRGNAHPTVVPYEVFAASDGHFILAVGNDGQFRRFCRAAGMASCADDARFATNAARVAHRESLLAVIAPVLAGRTRADWLATLEDVQVPAGPVNDIGEVFGDPQVRARNMRVEMAHEVSASGTVSLVGNPLKFSATPVSYRRAPPTLGEHTEEVLGEMLQLDGAARDRLRDLGVIGGPKG